MLSLIGGTATTRGGTAIRTVRASRWRSGSVAPLIIWLTHGAAAARSVADGTRCAQIDDLWVAELAAQDRIDLEQWTREATSCTGRGSDPLSPLEGVACRVLHVQTSRTSVEMPQRARQRTATSGSTRFWMRSVSFVGLHRMLHAAAAAPKGRTTAFALNKLAIQNGFELTRSSGSPSPTTLYHYRTTLLRLGVLRREDRILSPNDEDPRVRVLLTEPVPANGDGLSDTAKDAFAALALDNEDCRAVFFDLFMPGNSPAGSVTAFRGEGLPVHWRRDGPTKARRVVFQPSGADQSYTCSSPAQMAAVLYGVRYWARNELGLIDEYVGSADGSATMFPVSRPDPTTIYGSDRQPPLVCDILKERGPGEWTVFSVSDLIARHCREGRQPISALSGAIDWLVQHWRDYTVLIPTSRAMATLTAISPMQEGLVLRRYYRLKGGPYMSHIRLHAAIAADRPPPPRPHAATAQRSEARA